MMIPWVAGWGSGPARFQSNKMAHPPETKMPGHGARAFERSQIAASGQPTISSALKHMAISFSAFSALSEP